MGVQDGARALNDGEGPLLGLVPPFASGPLRGLLDQRAKGDIDPPPDAPLGKHSKAGAAALPASMAAPGTGKRRSARRETMRGGAEREGTLDMMARVQKVTTWKRLGPRGAA
jgi:hypothetical protein